MKKTRWFISALAALLVLVLYSCMLTDEYYEVEIHLTERSAWEHVIGTRLWYELRYLSSDGAVEQLYLPDFVDHVTLMIPKGSPCIAAAYLLGDYAPVGVCMNPELSEPAVEDGRIQLDLLSRDGPVAARLLEYRHEFSGLLHQMDFDLLSQSIWEASEGRPWSVDWGNLYYELQFGARSGCRVYSSPCHAITVEGLCGGYWVCDHRGMPMTSVMDQGGPLYLHLPEGTFTYLNPMCNSYLLQVIVESDGSARTIRIEVPRALYPFLSTRAAD